MDASIRAQLDELLTYGAEALDLTPTQYDDAVQKYQAVGDWLNKPESLLAKYDPLIYPQGSIAIGTATKPVGRDEFDLDLVCQLLINASVGPTVLKRIIGVRLRENAVYSDRLVEKNRCWRIEYAGQFHMDILPGCPDPRFAPSTALLVPDKELASWKETNPKGYAEWFAQRCRLSVQANGSARAYVEVPPPPPHVTKKMPLQIAVQILKRHRDLYFKGDEDAPISIIITTLAASAFMGQSSVYDTLRHLVTCMPSYIETDTYGNLVIKNPTNPYENFADKWRENPRKARMFFQWLEAVRRDLGRLAHTHLSDAVKVLSPFVGERAGSEAVRQYAACINGQRPNGLHAAPTTGALGLTHAQTRLVPRQTFFGGDSE